MKFTKYNNPSRKRSKKRVYSKAYVDQRMSDLTCLLAGVKSEGEREAIIKAFNISVNP